MRRTAAALFVLSTFSSTCTSTLPAPHLIRDLRMVAAIAEPPEVPPGATVELTFYFADPTNAGDTVLVSVGRCPSRGDTAGTTDCALGEEEVVVTGHAAAAGRGLFSFSARYQVPADLLLGRSVVAQTYGFDEVLLVHADSASGHSDGLKRVVISAGDDRARNKNPTLDGMYVIRNAELLGDTKRPPHVQAGQTYQALPAYDAATLEDYTLVRYDGSTIAQHEQAILSWSCAVDCDIDLLTSYDFSSVSVTPRSGAGLLLYLVMRDGRGGEAFAVLDAPFQ